MPVSASSEPAWAPKASGIRSCDGERREPDGHHDDDGQERGDRRRSTVISAVRTAHEQHHQDEQPRPAVACAARQLLAGPRR